MTTPPIASELAGLYAHLGLKSLRETDSEKALILRKMQDMVSDINNNLLTDPDYATQLWIDVRQMTAGTDLEEIFGMISTTQSK